MWLLCGCCVVVVVLLCFGFFFFLWKAILSFCDFWTFFVVFYFSFHFCFDLPQVSNC